MIRTKHLFFYLLNCKQRSRRNFSRFVWKANGLNHDYSNASYRAPTVDASFSATTKVIKQASATVNYGVNDILVFLNGVCLTPTTDYTISGTTMTLVGGAPPAGSNLVIRYLPLTG